MQEWLHPVIIDINTTQTMYNNVYFLTFRLRGSRLGLWYQDKREQVQREFSLGMWNVTPQLLSFTLTHTFTQIFQSFLMVECVFAFLSEQQNNATLTWERHSGMSAHQGDCLTSSNMFSILPFFHYSCFNKDVFHVRSATFWPLAIRTIQMPSKFSELQSAFVLRQLTNKESKQPCWNQNLNQVVHTS